jgi:hypothetical protein
VNYQLSITARESLLHISFSALQFLNFQRVFSQFDYLRCVVVNLAELVWNSRTGIYLAGNTSLQECLLHYSVHTAHLYVQWTDVTLDSDIKQCSSSHLQDFVEHKANYPEVDEKLSSYLICQTHSLY